MKQIEMTCDPHVSGIANVSFALEFATPNAHALDTDTLHALQVVRSTVSQSLHCCLF